MKNKYSVITPQGQVFVIEAMDIHQKEEGQWAFCDETGIIAVAPSNSMIWVISDKIAWKK